MTDLSAVSTVSSLRSLCGGPSFSVARPRTSAVVLLVLLERNLVESIMGGGGRGGGGRGGAVGRGWAGREQNEFASDEESEVDVRAPDKAFQLFATSVSSRPETNCFNFFPILIARCRLFVFITTVSVGGGINSVALSWSTDWAILFKCR